MRRLGSLVFLLLLGLSRPALAQQAPVTNLCGGGSSGGPTCVGSGSNQPVELWPGLTPTWRLSRTLFIPIIDNAVSLGDSTHRLQSITSLAGVFTTLTLNGVPLGPSACPSGSGTELQYRVDGTTCGSVTGSAFGGAGLDLGNQVTVRRVAETPDAVVSVYDNAYSGPSILTTFDGNTKAFSTTKTLPDPSAVTIGHVGATGAATVTYVAVCYTDLGYHTGPSADSTTNNANATLDGTNYNTVPDQRTNGEVSCDEYRTVGGPSQGLIAAAVTSFPFSDTGIAGGAEDPSGIVNTTGHVYVGAQLDVPQIMVANDGDTIPFTVFNRLFTPDGSRGFFVSQGSGGGLTVGENGGSSLGLFASDYSTPAFASSVLVQGGNGTDLIPGDTNQSLGREANPWMTLILGQQGASFPSSGAIRLGNGSEGIWSYDGSYGAGFTLLRYTIGDSGYPQITLGDNSFGKVDFDVQGGGGVIPSNTFPFGTSTKPWGAAYFGAVNATSLGDIANYQLHWDTDALGVFAIDGTTPAPIRASVAFTVPEVPVTAIGSLPACNVGSEGQIRGVNDALLPAALAIVAPGGAVHVPVYCDGSNWRVM